MLRPAAAVKQFSIADCVLRRYYILRYYRRGQLVGRLAQRGRLWLERRGWFKLRPWQDALPGLRSEPALAAWAEGVVHRRDNQAAAHQAEGLLAGRFCLLNDQRELPDPVDWHPSGPHGPSRLWRFALHYHEFLLDLAAEGLRTGEAAFLRRAWDLVAQWIEANRPDDPRVLDDAWHPYCISRRLPVWIALWHTVPAPPELGPRVLASLFDQARYLAGHLEWDLGGNHLLENLRGLVFSGVFFTGPEAEGWLRRAGPVVRRQLAEQVLAHGEHFERSPMYHARMLEVISDLRDVTAGLDPALSRYCGEAATRMAAFLESICHPDGGIPQLGDSSLDEGAESEEQRAESEEQRAESEEQRAESREPRAEGPASRDRKGAAFSREAFTAAACKVGAAADPAGRHASPARRVGPYWIFRDSADFLLFDTGPVGPDHLPAHAHADLLGLEASWHGRRLFVDSGVFDYEDSPMRRYCRSTAAHNCLEIDGQDQCDMWSRFRMGYRGWPGPLETGQAAGFHWASAWHNAYRRLGVPRVGRLVACRPGGPWLCLDWAEGRGTHRLTSRLHVHPDFHVTPIGDRAVELRCDGVRLRLYFLGRGGVSVEAGWYCSQFGLRLPAPVVRFESETALPASIAWCLVPAEGDSRPPEEWLERLLAAVPQSRVGGGGCGIRPERDAR